jgi:(p)ppGpp synthase/HD superfamily hydrolase
MMINKTTKEGTKMKKGEMLSAAILIATNAHAGQYDKGGKPYILHPLAVAALLDPVYRDEELYQVIAILHDVIEDTKVTYQELRDAGISERAIDGIKSLTKIPGQTFEEYKEGVFSNIDAMIVKKADLTHNTDIRRLKGVTEKDFARMVKYQMFYFEITQKLADNG